MYFLKSRIYIENRKIMYACRMIRNNLNMILKGDFGFAGRLQKNPLHHSWNTAWFNNDPYSLSVLIDWSMKQEFGADSDKCHVHDLTSRNETIFKSLLKFACRNKKELTYEYLESHAGYLNSLCPSFDTIIKTPLGNAEVRGIARSVWKFMQTRYTGSNKNGEGQYTDEQRKHSIENRTAKKWRNIHLFIEYQKMKIDLKTIASILHVTKKTIKNYIIILHTNLSVTNKTNSIASSHSADVPQNTENTNTANTTGVAKQREPPAPTKPPPIQRITDTVFQGIVAGRLLARTAAAGFAINTS
jgi:hypothetical protein